MRTSEVRELLNDPPDRSGTRYIRLSFSLNEPAKIGEGIARLAKLVRAMLPA